MKYIVNGACGAMGRHILSMLEENGIDAIKADVCGGEGVYSSISLCEEKADCIIDFSHHSATGELLDYAVKHSLPVVLATTGHTDGEKALIHAASKAIPIFYSANTSIGVALLCRLAKEAAKNLSDADIEIIEKHHNRKLDSPSGTALMLADEVASVREESNIVCGRSGSGKREKADIGISSVRAGSYVGEHEIIFHTGDEVITISHTAVSRKLFASGAKVAAEFVTGKPAGLYTMKDVLEREG